ncbi:UDP-4-amino-4,6-dideoxy-N-acetyl-beta-L-altrosamine transaminase [Tumebacillus permanentifrigoris]|uniref:UDP-4-amino-4, 6-dideoxy-N-acetyl-beta-L-altrosamine transaminase n=1 Tax=Tumebacillus permanentifrigoris TaxID=378543 RepID=A0A316DD80_9BACL|nr:UDP-4-amino-4,6-dideoxy-N-acetyl-beta-L-altrosamine transaminase [Tumebacillus permanentifrigoris]PWK16171.1 UDP-4-amino-4,6-dideoxy-N-acetyl-beta-L-altrosamine transaminase [Tumebacillus permanentifrigoris]
MEKLALYGGAPVRTSVLSYGQQWIEDHDVQAVVDTLRGSFITQGPNIDAFERAVADSCGAKYAVAFSNGTAALHGAAFAAGIGPGDEVITSPITFVASSNCVLYQGGTPVFADIRPDTYNLDPEAVRAKITERTKALIPVDFTGQPAEMDAFRRLADEHGLVLIEDAAHSIGATYKDRKVGTLADMTMFSFHPVKHITTGEGGIIVTDREEYAEKLRLFRSHGITRDAKLLTKPDEGPWYHEMHELGYNYRMTDLQAALGTSQMQRLDEFVARRREIVAAYDQAFVEFAGIVTPFQHEDTNSSWHLYILRFQRDKFTASRKQIFEALRAENIGVNVHYIPVYTQPYYQGLGYEKGLCPHAEALYEEIITIPLFPKMSAEDIADVIRAVGKVHAHFYKA